MDYKNRSIIEVIPLNAKLAKAFSVANALHVNDKRRGEIEAPYILHPLSVANRMISWGFRDAKLLSAALLHDVVEDHGKELLVQYLPKDQVPDTRMGVRDRIQDMVEDGTWEKEGLMGMETVLRVSNPILRNRASREEKIESYRNHVADTIAIDRRASIVKASDFLDNAGNLDNLENRDKAHSLALKYYPVGKILIHALEGFNEYSIANQLRKVYESKSFKNLEG